MSRLGLIFGSALKGNYLYMLTELLVTYQLPPDLLMDIQEFQFGAEFSNSLIS